MSFSESDSNMIMPVSPMYGNGGGFGNGWGGDFWLILIVLFVLGGWGGMGGFGGFGGGLGYDFPWLLNGQNGINANTNAGFNQAATTAAINGIQNSVTSGFGDVQLGIAGVNQNICQTGNGIVSAVNNGFASAEVANNARQIANMQQTFNAQTAMMQGFNNVQSQFADCCCENRLANCQTQNIIQNEGNATRFANATNTRDLITNQDANAKTIMDKLCQLELDGVKAQVEAKNDRIAELQTQLNMANLAASQTRQTTDIQNSIISELRSCPIPSQPVYGSQPIFTCPGNNFNYGCGCGAA